MPAFYLAIPPRLLALCIISLQSRENVWGFVQRAAHRQRKARALPSLISSDFQQLSRKKEELRNVMVFPLKEMGAGHATILLSQLLLGDGVHGFEGQEFPAARLSEQETGNQGIRIRKAAPVVESVQPDGTRESWKYHDL